MSNVMLKMENVCDTRKKHVLYDILENRSINKLLNILFVFIKNNFSLSLLLILFISQKGADIFGRSIVIMVWQRGTGFEHNQGLGGAEMFFDTLKLKQYTSGWYPLFPMHSLGSDSNDSP